MDGKGVKFHTPPMVVRCSYMILFEKAIFGEEDSVRVGFGDVGEGGV